eukprot:CAMPEP_0197696268 /NCGR_PEP_ID=MMETSP1338-20131121/116418_1 /TAXON_ID=43686 ORGANISM="Pelagodinium beii, Strain RCC1491" /NCGR_SAMPLE_ID=MMETSP1338 /ASSEMBLY_ACC=CAM_ASM_000754 /LENGTH=92 /DNA_ID=CAMNT_0043279361 /DNA_START=192 /DNA_END=466 /DNA_ORIENTATION=+
MKNAVFKLNEGLAREPLPLVVDLGCGLGISSLGLGRDTAHSVLAVDSSAFCVGYARSLAKRWGLCERRVRFEHGNAVDALEVVEASFHGTVG